MGSRGTIILEILFISFSKASLLIACISGLIFYENAHQYTGTSKNKQTHTHIHMQFSAEVINQSLEREIAMNVNVF